MDAKVLLIALVALVCLSEAAHAEIIEVGDAAAADLEEALLEEELRERRSLASGRWGLRPGKRSLASGRWGLRPGKRSAVEDLELLEAVPKLTRPRRSLASGRWGLRPGKRSPMPTSAQEHQIYLLIPSAL